MALHIDTQLTSLKLVPHIERLFELSAVKILALEKDWPPEKGTPVFTVQGRYTTRGWTEWTQGFQYGSALLQFDAMGDDRFLEIGRRGTFTRMAPHLSHTGVHDHGFNNISTYGQLLRLMHEGKIPADPHERAFYQLALKVSGAIQAARWTSLADGTGFIHSFNGPHSLFVDTIRSLRVLAVAHRLGHVLMGEQDRRISLLQRLVHHAWNTLRYNIYYGEGRDAYDVPGRVAHEAIFNIASGQFRCPNSQQGFSPFSTWTRGLAWALLGCAEQLEFFHAGVEGSEDDFAAAGGRDAFVQKLLRGACVTADFYLTHCCADGIPMWDTAAPQLHRLPSDYLNRPSDPLNGWEPVDSSAAAIAAQGLLRLGNYLMAHQQIDRGRKYRQAALTIAQTLFQEPYLSTNPKHQGLILHSVYHRPNGWDYVPRGQKVPNGESSMWGDYHARELALLILREARGEVYPTFFSGVASEPRA
ncbi:MAG: glycosyl hydrolase [Verrucomicrobiota bacterium]|nr:glycosyl hydrolase [Limisphaera sp.]MDW8381862.1 glycosyl hydrolase [Verrucomicrobiota bacterium]